MIDSRSFCLTLCLNRNTCKHRKTMINIRRLEAELWESADLLRQGSKLTSRLARTDLQSVRIEYKHL